MTEKLEKAAQQYLSRQDRRTHPDVIFDKAGRAYPSADEIASCCAHIRQPSRSYPYSLMTHCRTAKHIATREGLELKDLTHKIHEIRGDIAEHEGGDNIDKK